MNEILAFQTLTIYFLSRERDWIMNQYSLINGSLIYELHWFGFQVKLTDLTAQWRDKLWFHTKMTSAGL